MKTPLQELQDWVNTELRLDGYEHKVISDKIETMLEQEKKVIINAANNGCHYPFCYIDVTRDGQIYYNETFNTEKK